MLGQRRRRWANIKPSLVKYLAFSGQWAAVSHQSQWRHKSHNQHNAFRYFLFKWRVCVSSRAYSATHISLSGRSEPRSPAIENWTGTPSGQVNQLSGLYIQKEYFFNLHIGELVNLPTRCPRQIFNSRRAWSEPCCSVSVYCSGNVKKQTCNITCLHHNTMKTLSILDVLCIIIYMRNVIILLYSHKERIRI